MNFNSEDIKIYPVSNRVLGNNGSTISEYGYLESLNLEQNIVKPYNNILDNTKVKLSILEMEVNKNILFFPIGKYLINGYCIEIKEPVNISLNNYIPNVPTVNISYNIYLRLTLRETNINNGITITEIDGIDNNSGFTGVELLITTNTLNDTDLVSVLLLGTLIYQNETWEIQTNLNNRFKFKFNKMGVDLSNITELYDTNQGTPNNVEDWLNNSFIIDDGEII